MTISNGIQSLRPLLIIAALTCAAPAAWAQSGGGYDLAWSSMDSGSMILSGSNYELSGTIGQPDAAVFSGGGYELQGGFLQETQMFPTRVDDWALYK